MSFAQVLQPAIRLAEDEFPLSEKLAHGIATSRKIRQYPSTMRVYMPSRGRRRNLVTFSRMWTWRER